MKFLFTTLLLFLASFQLCVAEELVDKQYQLNHASGVASKVQLGDLLLGGKSVERVARIVFDPSGDTSQRTVATHSTGIHIPANAIITKSFFYAKTGVTSSSNDGTIAIQCNNANDIFSAADIDTANGGQIGTIGDGIQTGVDQSKMLLVGSSGCEIKIVVAVHALLTGKLDIFIKYVVAE